MGKALVGATTLRRLPTRPARMSTRSFQVLGEGSVRDSAPVDDSISEWRRARRVVRRARRVGAELLDVLDGGRDGGAAVEVSAEGEDAEFALEEPPKNSHERRRRRRGRVARNVALSDEARRLLSPFVVSYERVWLMRVN